MEQPAAEVLRSAARGDERALEQLVRMYYGPVHQYLHRMVGDQAEAEDLSQEVFMRMANALERFQGRCSFSTWLFQIAKNIGIDFLRWREAQGTVLRQEPEEGPCETRGECGVDGFEEAELLWSCISRLNPDLRSALVLRDLVGFQYAEIAEILGTTLSTVKWRIYEAREQVQSCYVEAAGMTEGKPRTLGGRLLNGPGI